MFVITSLVAFLALTEAKIDFNRAHRLVHPNQVPSHAKDNFKVKTVSSKGAASTYFVVNEFLGLATCDGYAHAQFGIAFNSCFQNSDTTTAKYTYSSKAGYYLTTIYNSTDCSDVGTAYENTVDPICVPSPDSTTYSYSVVDSATPWKYQTTQGIVSETFNTEGACGGPGSGDVYNWIAQGSCIPSTDDNGNPNSFEVTSCHGGYFGYTVFTDTACTTEAGSGTDRVHWCTANNDGGYEIHECTAGP